MAYQVSLVYVPTYDELSVKALYPKFIDLEDVRDYLPEISNGQKQIPREFFFNVVNSLTNGGIKELVEQFEAKRFGVQGDKRIKIR